MSTIIRFDSLLISYSFLMLKHTFDVSKATVNKKYRLLQVLDISKISFIKIDLIEK